MARDNLKFLIASVIGLLLLFVAFSLGHIMGKKSAAMQLAKANVEALATASASAEVIAEQRVDDAELILRQEQELKDVQQGCASDADCRVRRGCVILRQQGSDTSGIPACNRVGNGVRAPVPSGSAH